MEFWFFKEFIPPHKNYVFAFVLPQKLIQFDTTVHSFLRRPCLLKKMFAHRCVFCCRFEKIYNRQENEGMFDLTSKSGKELRDKITTLRMHVKIVKRHVCFYVWWIYELLPFDYLLFFMLDLFARSLIWFILCFDRSLGTWRKILCSCLRAVCQTTGKCFLPCKINDDGLK